jgi:hypothetical protein
MKIQITTDYMWDELTDSQRLKLITELVYTAPNAQEFVLKVISKLNKEKKNKID